MTFASIASGLGRLNLDGTNALIECEVEPGVWRRHPTLEPQDSRSDISRDGYMGVIFNAIADGNVRMIKRIIKAGWKRRWTMGDRGNFDYINIWPLIPTLYMARYGSWVPTLPTLILDKPKYTKGYRAHLTALHIMTEMMVGKRRWSHRKTLDLLTDRNSHNPWFHALWLVAMGSDPGEDLNLQLDIDSFDMDTAAYGWGSCPGEVMYALTLQAARLYDANTTGT